jgi:hypothetical protein
VSIDTAEQLREDVAALEGRRLDASPLPKLHEIAARYRSEHGVRADGAGVPQYARWHDAMMPHGVRRVGRDRRHSGGTRSASGAPG